MTELPQRACVVGGGTMGAGIATVFALAGVPTTVVARRAAAVDAISARIGGRLETHARLALVDDATAASARGRVEIRVGLGDGPYGLVFESIAEDVEAKRDLLARAEAELAGDGVLCTNTSSLAIGELASAVADPGRFAGWHWFNPPDLVALVEVVPGPETAEPTLGRIAGWTRALGRTPVVLRREIEGFVANRLQYALLREAYALVAAGVCTAADVDAAVTGGLGPRWAAVGPFALMDLAGLDVHLAVARELFPRLSRDQEVPEVLESAVRGGALGVKNGVGLLGAYGPDEAAARVELRDRMLAQRIARRD